MKTCFKCGVEKPLTEYYKHKKMFDGYLGKCKCCTKKDAKQNREDKVEYYLNYDRNRPNHKDRVKKCAERTKIKYKSEPLFREAIINSKKKWGEKNQIKIKAQSAANHALRDGKIERKHYCEHCGTGGRLHKHHWSYLEEHWLDIIWLCPACHGKEHKRLNELGRDPDNV